MQLSSTWSLIVTAIPALLVIASGVFKLSGSSQIVTAMTKVGVLEYMKYLGIAEIVFAILFLYPPTNVIGFILLVCYFSGALATDLSHKSSIVAPLVILALLFIAELIVNNNLFFVL
jgi:DoxX-like family